MPPMLQNLPSGSPHDQANQDRFSEQVRSRFPPGSPEAELVRELSLEGFRPATDLRAPRREAVFDRLGDFIHDICRRGGSIYWSADDVGHLTAVSGSYFIDCL
jgi:hypothetical protein